jgi:glutamate-1-semialdehyde 2,1-aminomutase
MCAYGPSILGYNNPEVDEAAKTQYGLGNTVSLASPVMIDLATELVDLVDAADWALFGKNGGDSTNLAVMIARAATGKEKILKVRDGYHGVSPWMQPEGSPGTLSSATDQVLTVEWNDLDSFEKTISDHPNEIACFISSPYNHPAFRDNELPQKGYWQKISSLCKKNGIILIVDDVRAGFRINITGSNVAYGFKPDLICFGKAIANGYPLSALVGSNDLKDTAEKVYFTGTQFFSAAPMAAAKATLLELRKSDAAKKMTDFGERLNNVLIKTAKDSGFKLIASGIPAMPYYRLDGVDRETHFSWIDHCTTNGVYMVGWHNHFISTAHTDEDLVAIQESAKKAFTALDNSKAQKT